ncbi:MAG TPA: hypothetical protein VMQ11_02805 [Alphaproteobacteria bacterium]|nr:hypothetical protein [Alphaproteobacteria bacterium]
MRASEIPYAAPAARAAIRPGYALAVAGAITPTLAIFAYKGLAPLFFTVAVVELGLFWRQNRRLPHPPLAVAVLFAAFVIWGVIGMAWSLDAMASLATAGKLALMAALGLLLLQVARDLDPACSRLATHASLWGLIVGLGFMAIEVFFGSPITHFLYEVLRLPHAVYPSMLDPAATVLVLVTAYVTGELLSRKRFGPALIIGAVAVTLALLSESMAAGLAGVVAVPVLAAVYWGGPSIGRGLAILSAVAILAAPLLPSRVLGPIQEHNWDAVASIYQRIGIWRFTETRIDERPVLGWGLDAARRIPGGHDGIKAENMHVQNPVVREKLTRYFNSGNIEQMPLHPHDAALQIWLEAGGIGAGLTAVFVVVTLFGAAGRWPVNRVGSAAAFAFGFAALVVCALSYGIWQTWWLAILFLGTVFLEIVMSRVAETASWNRSNTA